jgi:allantoin racemase
MSRLLVINPNSTVSMTEKIAGAARAVRNVGTEIVARTSLSGPPAIQGPEDGEIALPGLLAEIEKSRAERFDAIVISCFDDTGLYQARRLTGVPVLGIGESAFHAVMFVAERFSVVTTLSVSLPVIRENLQLYGLAARCAGVRASDVPVLDLETPGSDARLRISREIARAIDEDGADAIVLGCAGMADLAADLSREHALPVIDGVAAAVKAAEGLAAMALRTSQRGSFALEAV